MKKVSVILIFLLFSAKLFAAPSAEDLLSACETSLEKGFHGASGMMCNWYVTPCDCHHGKDSEIPRVCLPEDLETEYLANLVVSGLEANLELKNKSAEVAAGKILVERYPCD